MQRKRFLQENIYAHAPTCAARYYPFHDDTCLTVQALPKCLKFALLAKILVQCGLGITDLATPWTSVSFKEKVSKSLGFPIQFGIKGNGDIEEVLSLINFSLSCGLTFAPNSSLLTRHFPCSAYRHLYVMMKQASAIIGRLPEFEGIKNKMLTGQDNVHPLHIIPPAFDFYMQSAMSVVTDNVSPREDSVCNRNLEDAVMGKHHILFPFIPFCCN